MVQNLHEADLHGANPSSSRDDLSPSLLALLHHFTHIESWMYLEQRPILQTRMPRHELNGMIHVPCLKHEYAAELFLGLRIGTVSRRDFPVLPMHGQRRFFRGKSFSTNKVPVGAQIVVVLKTFVEHRVSLVLGHARVFCWLVVSRTDVFHWTSPFVGQRRTLARWVVHFIVVGPRENRQQSRFLISIAQPPGEETTRPAPAEPGQAPSHTAGYPESVTGSPGGCSGWMRLSLQPV